MKNVYNGDSLAINNNRNLGFVGFRKSALKNKSQKKTFEGQNDQQEKIEDHSDVNEVRKSYAQTYGKDTNNLVELYNFYRKNL